MARPWIAACLLAACYSPSPSPGAPCGAGEACPSGLRCIAGTCQLGPGEIDAAGDGQPIDAAWSTPVKVPGVNSNFVDEDPSLTADRLTIVFSSDRDGNFDIFIGTRATTADPFLVTALTAVNTSTDDKSPEISPDGNTLHFTSNRAGNDDVYRSTRTGTAWSAPVLVAELSSPSASDGDLAISPDELTAIVSRSNQMLRATRATVTAPFGVPVAVPMLDFPADASAPSIGGSGAVYFHAGATRDLYVAKPQGAGYATPLPITELNTAVRDAAPFVSADEKFLWFERAGEIYESTR